jgi:hypothetical protein
MMIPNIARHLGVGLLLLSFFGCSSTPGGGAASGSHPIGTGASVTQNTGPQGGSLTLEGTTLEIPAGALDGNQSISITSTTDVPPSGVTNLSPIYRFGPEGLTFKVPVAIHMSFAGGTATPVIVWSTIGGSGFERVDTTMAGSVASGTVTHFSGGFVADASSAGSLPGVADAGAAGDDGPAMGSDASPAVDASTGGGCMVCASGLCGAACPSGTTACGAGKPPSCADLSSDPSNCGSCGNTCSAGQGCLQGLCAPSCGANTFGSCSGGGLPNGGGLDCSHCGQIPSVCGNSCADLASDPRNCGTCGNQCAPGQSCQSGACNALCAGGGVCTPSGFCVASCPSGQTPCGGTNNSTGFCVDTQTDSNNCSACGQQCPAGQVCANGGCVQSCGLGARSSCTGPPSQNGGTINCSTCGQNYAACGNYCVDLTSDPINCGTCGTACSAGQVCRVGVCGAICPNSEVCAKGVCVSVCPTGSVQCGAVGANATASCTDVGSDPGNCGACGNVCPQGEGCFAGSCVAACGASTAADGGTSAGGGSSGPGQTDAQAGTGG